MVRYTNDHEWLRAEADGTLTVGITAYAREQIGEILFAEPPRVGTRMARGEEAWVIESSKSVIEVRMPLTGVIVAVNDALTGDVSMLNRDPLGAGWLMRVRPDSPAEFEGLLDATGYARLVAGSGQESEL